MSGHPSTAPCIDTKLMPELRRRLADVGFDEANIGIACGLGPTPDPWSLATGRPVRDGTPLSTVVTLFWSGAPVEAADADRALGPLRLADLVRLGLVEIRDGHAHPLCAIQPADGLLVASDLPASGAAERVLGIVPASETLARLTARRTAKLALDLGTGSGVQALLLARHAETVLAVDVNPRALAFADFNAALNGTANLRGMQGSWFAPVTEERFDAIVSNPPYVISPDSAYTYRDGGLPRDAVSRMVVREASRHLADGGVATILCNWVQDGSPLDAPRAWVEGTGCDALILHYASVEPAAYAARLNGDLRARSPADFEATVRRWTGHYRAEGITRIGLGAVILRRRAGATNWVRGLDVAAGPSGGAGEHVLRLIAAADFLESPRGSDLLGRAFRMVDGHRVDQTLGHPEGKYVVGPAIFRFPAGIGLEARIDPRALDVLLECDGRRTLGDLVRDAAERRGEDVGSVSELVAGPVRHLVERGFMVPMVDD